MYKTTARRSSANLVQGFSAKSSKAKIADDVYEQFCKSVEVDSESGCWVWTGHKDVGGYGLLGYNYRQYKAHRIAWMLKHNETIPKGVQVCHTCDNRACVNPDHLFLGTAKDNMQDRSKKIKQKRGKTRNPDRFKKDEILKIRAAANSGLSFWQIAESHTITPSQVHEIVIREDWPWLQ